MPGNLVRAFAPGRVNLIGEHTDYNEGLALPCAIEAGVTVTAQSTDDGLVRVLAADLGERDEFPACAPPRAEGWRALVRGVVAELAPERSGAGLEISSNLPHGSGLSSSAALTVALALAVHALAADATEPDRIDLARLCSRVESEWAGAHTGLLDQLASLYGESDHAVLIDFRTLQVTPVPLNLSGWRLVILDSGEQHANASSGYNARRAECEDACRLLGVKSLRDASLEDIHELPDPLQRRVRHVITENERVRHAVGALQAGDLPRLGELIDASHTSLRDDYEASTSAVESTVDALKKAGAAGTRIVGGGFGGHVLGLLPPQAAPPPRAREVRPAAGARIL